MFVKTYTLSKLKPYTMVIYRGVKERTAITLLYKNIHLSSLLLKVANGCRGERDIGTTKIYTRLRYHIFRLRFILQLRSASAKLA